MKTVWITRTKTNQPDSTPPGWRALNVPLLTVAPPSTLPTPPRQNDVLVFTSQNAVLWFCSYTTKRHWTVYTVGDATAEQARDAGFNKVISAHKDVTALSDLIKIDTSLKSKSLYYASGREVSGNLEADLRSAGYQVERSILYETSPISYIPPEFKSGRPVTVLLYSTNGAKAFRNLDLDFTVLKTVSISANVDAELAGLGLQRRKIAQKPIHKALIKQLD